MKQVDRISLKELTEMAEKMFGSIVKADVDLAKDTMVVDMGMHVEGEEYLLQHGSRQRDLWGINLHPSKFGTDDFIEFDSMINIRPRQNNPSKNVLDVGVRTQIIALVQKVVYE